MKVLLISAPLPERLQEFILTHRGDILVPPLSLGYLASALEGAGNEVRIIDLIISEKTFKTAEEAILEFTPQLVGISCATPTFYNALRIAKISKELLSSAVVVMGGCHVTFTADETLGDTANVDVVVRGEGEKTVVELVDCLQSGSSLSGVLGVSYREDGNIFHNKPRPFVQDLDEFAWPARHLFDLDSYATQGTLVTTRGCPARCVFCAAAAMSGGRYRTRLPGCVVDEIEHIYQKHGARSYAILDDTFTAQPNKLTIPVCHEIIRRGMHLTFKCESRVDVATPELLATLHKAGCRSIQFGVETGSPRVLEKLGKRITLDQVRTAVRAAVDLGIKVLCSFILGLPLESEEDVYLTMRLIDELRGMGAETALGCLTPFPGTAIYENAEILGVTIHETDWEKFNFYTPIISTKHLSMDKARALFLDSYMRLMAPKENVLPF